MKSIEGEDGAWGVKESGSREQGERMGEEERKKRGGRMRKKGGCPI
jgi:hypothetical protein